MSCSSSSVSPFSSITSLCGHSHLANSGSLFSNAQESGDQFVRHPFAPSCSEVISSIYILFVPSDKDNNSKQLTKDESKPRADQRRKGRRKFTSSSSLQAGHMSHSSEQGQEGGTKKFALPDPRLHPIKSKWWPFHSTEDQALPHYFSDGQKHCFADLDNIWQIKLIDLSRFEETLTLGQIFNHFLAFVYFLISGQFLLHETRLYCSAV